MQSRGQKRKVIERRPEFSGIRNLGIFSAVGVETKTLEGCRSSLTTGKEPLGYPGHAQ